MSNKIPKFIIVAINETNYWDLSDLQEVEKVYGVYLVDLNRITHCCEITPSYYLHWITDDYTLKESFSEVSEDRREYIEDYIRYNCCKDGNYYHCKYVDSIKSIPVQLSDRDLEDFISDDISYEGLIESVCEEVS